MIDVLLAFGLGLAAGLHCIGMCGPIVLAMQKSLVGEWKWAGNLAYNLGRVVTYCAVGFILALAVGGAKDVLPAAGAKRWISLVVNGFL
ncbi:MAG: urease accessory protein UreH domain-containing protein, partial [Planctomycetota bacterium]